MQGFQYTNNTLDFFPHPEGYAKALPAVLGGGSSYQFKYVFTYTDHLGNIRLKYAQDPSNNNRISILEEDHYYPYGLKHSGYNSFHQIFTTEDGDLGPGTGIVLTPVNPFLGDSHKYKFGGKEYQDEFDVNTYDFGARNYDPTLGRWMNIDPLAEMMRRHSPYNYAFNNPVYFIDPDGMIPIPGAGGSGLLVMDTNALGTSDTSTGGFGVNVNAGSDASSSVYVEKNGNISGAAYQSKFKQMRTDFAKSDLSVGGDGPGDPPSSHDITPFELGVEWLTGAGPRHRDFTNGDYMTELLREHSHVQNTRDMILKSVADGGKLEDVNPYELGGIQGVGKYVKDYSTLLTAGQTGNLAVTYLGSNNLRWSATIIGSNVIVKFNVENSSTMQSASRPPVVGYWPIWQKTVGRGINNAFRTGAGSKTSQSFNWTETIRLNK